MYTTIELLAIIGLCNFRIWSDLRETGKACSVGVETFSSLLVDCLRAFLLSNYHQHCLLLADTAATHSFFKTSFLYSFIADGDSDSRSENPIFFSFSPPPPPQNIMNTSMDSFPEAIEPRGGTPTSRRSEHSVTSGVSLPNVFVTPPEEEQSVTPPFCYFDAEKDAQPGAPAYDDIHADLDYSAHADDLPDMEDTMHSSVAEPSDRENVFVMRSLMEEAESLREKLRALELSKGTNPSQSSADLTATHASGEPVPQTPPPPAELAKSPRKSFFSLKSIGRKKSRKTLPFASTAADVDADHDPTETARPSMDVRGYEVVQYTESILNVVTTDVTRPDSQCTTRTRKTSFLSRLSKLSPRKSGELGSRKLDAKRSFEALSSSMRPGNQDQKVTRRFSFFELSRRVSVSSQSTVPSTAMSISQSINQSQSSIATSSASPLTPGDVNSPTIFTSPPATPLEESSVKTESIKTESIISSPPMSPEPTSPVHDIETSFSSMDFSIDNLATSLSIPKTTKNSHTGPSFALDPLHFESLQFDSDEFL